MKNLLTCLSAGVFFLVVGCLTVCGQGTAQISGTVKDQTGAVLPGAEVTATQTETGLSRTVVSNETGAYVLASLPTGPYKLEVALPGSTIRVGADGGRNRASVAVSVDGCRRLPGNRLPDLPCLHFARRALKRPHPTLSEPRSAQGRIEKEMPGSIALPGTFALAASSRLAV